MILTLFYEAIMARLLSPIIRYITTSVSSILIGTGSRTFTVATGLSFLSGQVVKVKNSELNFMEGTVTSYNGTQLIVNVTAVTGAGIFATWAIGIVTPSLIKHFDMYAYQDMNDKDEDDYEAYNTPAVFFRWHPLDTNSIGPKKQHIPAQFSLLVESTVIPEIANRESQGIRNNGHKHMQLIDDINYQLQGFNSAGLTAFANGASFNTISRVGLPELYRPSAENTMHVITYKTVLTDVSAVRAALSVPHPQNLEVDLTIQDGDDDEENDTITIPV